MFWCRSSGLCGLERIHWAGKAIPAHFFPQKTAIASPVNAAQPFPPAWSMLLQKRSSCTYICPSADKVSVLHV